MMSDPVVKDKTKTVQRVFSSVARNYDRMNDLMSLGLHRPWKSALVDSLFISRHRPFEVLDIAGGTGDLSQTITRQYPKCRCTLLDRNREMIRAGHERRSRELTAQIRWSTRQHRCSSPGQGRILSVNADAGALPFADQQFDAVCVAFGIRNFSTRELALKEMFRVLRRGGRFSCLEFCSPDRVWFPRAYARYRQRVLPALGEFVAGDADAYRYLSSSIDAFPDAPDFAREIAESGFHRVKYQRYTGGIVAIHGGWRR